MITISKPIKANSTQLSSAEKTELNAFNLREMEISNIRTNMLQLEVMKCCYCLFLKLIC